MAIATVCVHLPHCLQLGLSSGSVPLESPWPAGGYWGALSSQVGRVGLAERGVEPPPVLFFFLFIYFLPFVLLYIYIY
jgi:hypothetical protein